MNWIERSYYNIKGFAYLLPPSSVPKVKKPTSKDVRDPNSPNAPYAGPKNPSGSKLPKSTSLPAYPPMQKPDPQSPVVSTATATGRDSYPNFKEGFLEVIGDLRFVRPEFMLDLIPVVRKMFVINENLGLALNDLVQLTNTGHKLVFDRAVSDEQANAMREHIRYKSKSWGDGVAGLNGLINKLIAQIYIGGAASVEWVVQNDKKGIGNCVLVNPEDIRFNYNFQTTRYEPYQKVWLTYELMYDKALVNYMLQQLNPFTFRYYGLINDTELPYGVPPFIAALPNLRTQKNMLKNLEYISEELGLVGFMELLMQKPARWDDEDETAYTSRLINLLTTTKDNTKKGMMDGITVGFKEDHEFKFNSTAKNISGVRELWEINQTLVANGLKYPTSFMGVNSKTETNITIIFTKMISQLTTVQNIAKEVLEYGIKLELILAGFRFKTLDLIFNSSTITDDLKLQQAKEIKIRNLRTLYNDGIISQEQYADDMGYEEPDQPEPRQIVDPDQVIEDVQGDQKREKDKDTSDRKSRAKKKPQPKGKDQKPQ